MAGADCGATGIETRIYLYCLYWLFGTHSLQRDTMLGLDIVGRALVLQQNNVLEFVDFPWEALFSLRSGWEWGRWEVEKAGRGEGEKTGICM